MEQKDIIFAIITAASNLITLITVMSLKRRVKKTMKEIEMIVKETKQELTAVLSEDAEIAKNTKYILDNMTRIKGYSDKKKNWRNE